MSFFNNIGNLFTNPINTIGSGINWVSGTGLGHSVGGFFTNTLSSASNLLSGLSNIPADLGGLVNSLSSNSTLFLWGIIIIGGLMVFNDLKGGSSSSYNSYRSYS